MGATTASEHWIQQPRRDGDAECIVTERKDQVLADVAHQRLGQMTRPHDALKVAAQQGNAGALDRDIRTRASASASRVETSTPTVDRRLSRRRRVRRGCRTSSPPRASASGPTLCRLGRAEGARDRDSTSLPALRLAETRCRWTDSTDLRLVQTASAPKIVRSSSVLPKSACHSGPTQDRGLRSNSDCQDQRI